MFRAVSRVAYLIVVILTLIFNVVSLFIVIDILAEECTSNEIRLLIIILITMPVCLDTLMYHLKTLKIFAKTYEV